jgi:hypothetical protein
VSHEGSLPTAGQAFATKLTDALVGYSLRTLGAVRIRDVSPARRPAVAVRVLRRAIHAHFSPEAVGVRESRTQQRPEVGDLSIAGPAW